jgi:small GTP-binding protein
MQESMLTEPQTEFVLDEKEALSGILLRLAEIGTPQDILAALQKSILQLDELFLIVVVGEFNSGKSTLVNALLGQKVLPEGVTPTTSRVTLVKWGEQAAEHPQDEGFSIYTFPLALLKEINIVDSPGTNAIIRHHEQLTSEYVPRSDLVLFVTSADRPMTESERQFLDRILAWGKKIVFVLNKSDILEDDQSLREVSEFVSSHAAAVLGYPVELFTVSSRLAQRAWTEPDEIQRQKLRSDSGITRLEQYITTTLDDAAKLRYKLSNPLGVAEKLVNQAEIRSQAQADDLSQDLDTVNALEGSVAGFQRELQSELAPRLAEVETILQRLEIRGLDFFDSTLRLTNIHNLVRGDKIRAQFEKEVLADVPHQIEEQVHRVIDWLVEKDLREWQQVMGYLQRRQAQHIDQIVGNAADPQTNRRRELIETVGKTAFSIVDTYDRTKEASQLAAQVETAVAQTALFEAGAVGLGALVTTAVLSSALDITGTIAAGTLAIVGFFVIPYKRKKAKESFKEKITALRGNLLQTLTAAFNRESEEAVNRLKENSAPYTRFVHAEQDRIHHDLNVLSEIRMTLAGLKARIDQVVHQE